MSRIVRELRRARAAHAELLARDPGGRWDGWEAELGYALAFALVVGLRCLDPDPPTGDELDALRAGFAAGTRRPGPGGGR